MSAGRPPRIAILYHFFTPDDVVSAQEFAGLAGGLAARGWEVEALTSNRRCHAPGAIRPSREVWNGVAIRRVWRPGLRQASGLGRISNALWMIAAWSGLAFTRGKRQPDIILMGTDPILSVLVAGVVRTLNPRIKLVHWAFDLYPEAAVADGLVRENSLLVRTLKRLLRGAYGACDLIADIGPCMRRIIAAYGPKGKAVTLVPWALAEPTGVERPDPTLRRELFGDAKLAILYSGSFGRAHDYQDFLALARQVRGTGIVFGFAVRGNRAAELKAAVTPEDTNVRFLPFAAEADLARHLAAADVHLASLRENWTGLVVPSKFFGSLATGRPVLFAGSADSAIAQWIAEEKVGWRLSSDGLERAATELRRLAEQPEELAKLQRHCWETYRRRFSREEIISGFDREMRALLPPSLRGSARKADFAPQVRPADAS